MKASKFFPPYFKKGNLLKCTLRNEFTNCAGVYLIKKGNEIIYVGKSENNIYRTLYRHFQEWNEKGRERVVYPKTGYLIRVIKTTEKQASRLERYLINKFKPKDNGIKYELFQMDDKIEDIGKMDYFSGKDYIVDEYEF